MYLTGIYDFLLNKRKVKKSSFLITTKMQFPPKLKLFFQGYISEFLKVNDFLTLWWCRADTWFIPLQILWGKEWAFSSNWLFCHISLIRTGLIWPFFRDWGSCKEYPKKIILPQNKSWRQSISWMGDLEDLKKHCCVLFYLG